MVAGRHNLSRRAVLGACVGVPALLGGDGALAAPSPFGLSLSKPSPPLGTEQGKNALRQAQGERSDKDAVRSRWPRALAGFRRAEARLAAFQAEVARLPPEARAFPAAIPLDARFDTLECARLAALKRLLRAPAPDIAALALKLDLAIADQAWELTGAVPCLAALQADARRLARLG